MEDIICTRCGLVNDYFTTESGPHIKATCNGCDKYIKMLPKSYADKPLYFGKYKGRLLSSLKEQDELSWVLWAVRNATLKPKQLEEFKAHLLKCNVAL